MRYLLIFVLVLSTHSYAATLTPFSIEYDVSKNGMFLGGSKRTLTQQADGLWKVTALTEPEGLVSLFVSDQVIETSLIKVHNAQIQPQSYRYEKSNSDEPESFSVQFNWQQQELSHSGLGKIQSLNSDHQDLLSFQLAMMLELQNNKQSMQFVISDKKRIETYDLKTVGSETIETDLGPLHTIKLEYYDQQRKRRYTFWCAKELSYLPYKTQRVEEDDDVIVIQLRHYNGKSARVVTDDEF